MLEKTSIQQRGFRNILQNGEIIGFQLRARSLYYRGLWLSQITSFTLAIDGEKIDNSQITWTIGDKIYPVNEMHTKGDVHWGILDPAIITVSKKGGLTSGAHIVELDIMHSSSYMPPEMDYVLSTRSQKRELILA